MKTKKTKIKVKEGLDDLVQSIGAIVRSMRGLAHQAEAQYTIDVEDIINSKNRNPRRIEPLLDYMLGFCFDDRVLGLYKKLCRYYFFIDPEATVFYINSYREMWDEKSLQPSGKSAERGRRRK